jgi:hypothetical protein
MPTNGAADEGVAGLNSAGLARWDIAAWIWLIVGLAAGLHLGAGRGDATAWAAGGAAVGIILGWLCSISAGRLSKLLSVVEGAPPPTAVFRFGAALGGAEGALIGMAGGTAGALFGSVFGAMFGETFAVVAWRVRRRVALLVPALLLGAGAEAAGSLMIASFVGKLARDPALLTVVSATTGGACVLLALTLPFINRIDARREAARCPFCRRVGWTTGPVEVDGQTHRLPMGGRCGHRWALVLRHENGEVIAAGGESGEPAG